jgi:hypothetical protein
MSGVPWQRKPVINLRQLCTRDFLVVVGVQHETTGKATFTSLAVYNPPRLMGIAAVTGDELLNSADRYLPTHPQRRYLYELVASFR